MQNSLKIVTKITILISPILTALFTELDEFDIAIGIVIVDAKEKRIMDVVRVLALTCCNQGCIDLVIIIA